MIFRPAAYRILFAICCVAAFAVAPASAERADRTKPLNVEADHDSTVDMLNHVVVFTGNVVLTKGSIVIRADKIEVHETLDGYRDAVAIGSAAHPATFRQKRDGLDEFIEGRAERLEYDSRADTVRFLHSALVRRLRGDTVSDQITGSEITYDNVTEVFSVVGGNGSPATGNPSGRVKAVLTPRQGSQAASDVAAAEAAAAAASAAASAAVVR